MNIINKTKVTQAKKGFTLIELVVVIAILAVLALILIPSITGYVKKANTAKNLANARSIYTTVILVEQKTPFTGNKNQGNKLDFAANYKPGAEPNRFKNEVFDMVGVISEPYSITKTSDGYIVEVNGTSTTGGAQYPESN